jgi:hypothetical protein
MTLLSCFTFCTTETFIDLERESLILLQQILLREWHGEQAQQCARVSRHPLSRNELPSAFPLTTGFASTFSGVNITPREQSFGGDGRV